MKKFTALLAGAALLMMATSALATPITGIINFTGAELLTPTAAALHNATGMDFGNSEVHGIRTGTYAAIPVNIPVTFSDVTFNPFIEPVDALWSLTYLGITYSFELETLQIDLQSSTHLDLSGKGVLHATGYEDTAGSWFYSTQGSGSTFSAEADASPVPEPGTLMLLGAGFFGVAVLFKRNKNQSGAACAA
jgi:hypothetical protein